MCAEGYGVSLYYGRYMIAEVLEGSDLIGYLSNEGLVELLGII